MEFECDAAKNRNNFVKHGVLFAYAVRAFLDPYRTYWIDSRRDHGEERRITLGKIGGRLFVVTYTLRGPAVRIVSARKANIREQKAHDNAVSA